jgi:hypothetical protein
MTKGDEAYEGSATLVHTFIEYLIIEKNMKSIENNIEKGANERLIYFFY